MYRKIFVYFAIQQNKNLRELQIVKLSIQPSLNVRKDCHSIMDTQVVSVVEKTNLCRCFILHAA